MAGTYKAQYLKADKEQSPGMLHIGKKHQIKKNVHIHIKTRKGMCFSDAKLNYTHISN